MRDLTGGVEVEAEDGKIPAAADRPGQRRSRRAPCVREDPPAGPQRGNAPPWIDLLEPAETVQLGLDVVGDQPVPRRRRRVPRRRVAHPGRIEECREELDRRGTVRDRMVERDDDGNVASGETGDEPHPPHRVVAGEEWCQQRFGQAQQRRLVGGWRQIDSVHMSVDAEMRVVDPDGWSRERTGVMRDPAQLGSRVEQAIKSAAKCVQLQRAVVVA
jgi:hypothetical protein